MLPPTGQISIELHEFVDGEAIWCSDLEGAGPGPRFWMCDKMWQGVKIFRILCIIGRFCLWMFVLCEELLLDKVVDAAQGMASEIAYTRLVWKEQSLLMNKSKRKLIISSHFFPMDGSLRLELDFLDCISRVIASFCYLCIYTYLNHKLYIVVLCCCCKSSMHVHLAVLLGVTVSQKQTHQFQDAHERRWQETAQFSSICIGFLDFIFEFRCLAAASV